MGVNGTGVAAGKVSVNPFPWGAACLRCPFAPMAAPGKAARPKPWRCLAAFSRGRRWGEDAFLVRVPWFLGLWLGGGRFFSAPPAGQRPIALTGACGRCPGFLLGWRPVRARSRLFEKRRPKNFYARCARRPVSLLYDLFRLMAPLEQRLPQGASRCLAMADSQGQGVGGIIGLGDFLQSQQPPGHLPVSYTHLDVYKRQPRQWPPGASRRRRARRATSPAAPPSGR